jgi:hypothetical protein
MMHLTSENVDATVLSCLPDDDPALIDRIEKAHAAGEEMPEGIKMTRGILSVYVFDEFKLDAHRNDILEMLSELPGEFIHVDQGGGGGWSFLNACMTASGEQWTGLHQQMEALFCLGMAIGAVEEQLPREMWDKLPGGMPYYSVSTATEEEAD